MEPESVFSILNAIGLFVFAISGAPSALRKNLDILAVVMIAFFTGAGGGTIRDVTLGTFPVWWVEDLSAIGICVFGAFVAALAQPMLTSRRKALIWADAAGLSVFAVLGAEAALTAGAPFIVAIFMGVVTATFGGIIRDLILGEPSLIMKQEIYATAALIGAAIYVGLTMLEVPYVFSAPVAAIITFAARGVAIVFGLSMPKLGGSRPPE